MKISCFLLSCMILPICFLLTSCADEYDRLQSGHAVVFTTDLSSVGASSRAANDSWAVDDRVGIYMVSDRAGANDADLSTAITENVQYRASESELPSFSLIAVGNRVFYPNDGSDVNFVAYYPYQGDMHTTQNHIYPVDVTTQNPLSAIDLLYHKDTSTGYNKNSGSVDLKFSHKLSKLNITVVRESANVVNFSAVNSLVGLDGFPRKANFNLSTGELNNLDDVSTRRDSIAPIKNTTVSNADSVVFESIIVPHDGDDYTRIVHLTIDGETYSYMLPAAHDFEWGKAYSYRFTFTGRGLILGDNQIVDWDNGSTAWDENYHLTVSESKVSIHREGATNKTLSIRTNFDGADIIVSRSNSKTNVVNSGVAWITLNNGGKPTLSGDTYTLSYSVTTNESVSPRTAYLHVACGNMTVVVEVVQLGSFTESANCIILKTNGATAHIPVAIANEAAAFHEKYKGTSAQRYDPPFATVGQIDFMARVLWVDVPAFSDASRRADVPTDIIAEVGAVCNTLSDSYLRVTPGSKEGNAVICILRPNPGGDPIIVWSWHIWVVNDMTRASMWIKNSPDNTFTTKPAPTANGYSFFPLNLGAFAANDNAASDWTATAGWSGHPYAGLYYQWGRKDPFTNRLNPTWIGRGLDGRGYGNNYIRRCDRFVKDRGETYVGVNSIQNPYVATWTSGENKNDDSTGHGWQGTIHLRGVSNNSWGYADSIYSEKSPFDPCPAGWRVPPGGTGTGNITYYPISAWRGVWNQYEDNADDHRGINYGMNGWNLTYHGGFYPIAGHRFGGGDENNLNADFASGLDLENSYSWGDYWTAGSAETFKGFHLYVAGNPNAGSQLGGGTLARYRALSVRCVAE